MEFSQELEQHQLDTAHLQQLLSIKSLPTLCASITAVLSENGDEGTIYCLWGQFDICRTRIKYGIRFSLLNCPHALAWTVTIDKTRKKIIIHCTTDKKEQDKDFIDSIHDFINDWSKGLNKALN